MIYIVAVSEISVHWNWPWASVLLLKSVLRLNHILCLLVNN